MWRGPGAIPGLSYWMRATLMGSLKPSTIITPLVWYLGVYAALSPNLTSTSTR